MQRDHDDGLFAFLLVDDRFFSQSRESGDRVDAGLDLAQQLVEVGVGVNLDRHLAESLECVGANVLDPNEILDGVLDLEDDAFLDFLRRRTEVGTRTWIMLSSRVGLVSLRIVTDRDQAPDDNQDHQEVRGDMFLANHAIMPFSSVIPGPRMVLVSRWLRW